MFPENVRENFRLIDGATIGMVGLTERKALPEQNVVIHLIAENGILMMPPAHWTLASMEKMMLEIRKFDPEFEKYVLLRWMEFVCFSKKAAKILAAYEYVYVRDMLWASYGIC